MRSPVRFKCSVAESGAPVLMMQRGSDAAFVGLNLAHYGMSELDGQKFAAELGLALDALFEFEGDQG